MKGNSWHWWVRLAVGGLWAFVLGAVFAPGQARAGCGDGLLSLHSAPDSRHLLLSPDPSQADPPALPRPAPAPCQGPFCSPLPASPPAAPAAPLRWLDDPGALAPPPPVTSPDPPGRLADLFFPRPVRRTADVFIPPRGRLG